MNQKNDFTVINCKNCKYYRCKIVDSKSSVHSCLRDNKVEPDKFDLLCNRPCFKQSIRKKISNKKSR